MIKILLSTELDKRKCTQADLAHKTGIRPEIISDLYQGTANGVSLKQLDLICDALAANFQTLLLEFAISLPTPFFEQSEPLIVKSEAVKLASLFELFPFPTPYHI